MLSFIYLSSDLFIISMMNRYLIDQYCQQSQIKDWIKIKMKIPKVNLPKNKAWFFHKHQKTTTPSLLKLFLTKISSIIVALQNQREKLEANKNLIQLVMKKKQEEKCTSKRLWSKEEDQLLLSLVSIYGSAPKWSTISEDFNREIKLNDDRHHTQRTNKQCRERWQNHLNPTLKNNLPWTNDQHRALFKLFKDHSHQWCRLSQKLQLQGFQRRSDNNIKNYFYSALKRQVKSINEIIRQNNKEIKKKKSKLHNYSQKYTYKPRLSLQRKIRKGSPQQLENDLLTQKSECNLSLPNSFSQLEQSQIKDLHIVKELDQDLISKILLIAEEKGDKKYVISNLHTQTYQTQAQKLRDELIQMIMNKDIEVDPSYVLNLAKQMLQISRKCKRKNTKERPQLQSQQIEQNQVIIQHNNFNEQNQIDNIFKLPPQVKMGQKPVHEPNSEEMACKFMEEEKSKDINNINGELEKSGLSFGMNNQFFHNPYNVNCYPSIDFSRNMIERSSQLFGSSFVYPTHNHNISIFDNNIASFNPEVEHKANLDPFKKDSFLNQIRTEPLQQSIFQIGVSINPNPFFRQDLTDSQNFNQLNIRKESPDQKQSNLNGSVKESGSGSGGGAAANGVGIWGSTHWSPTPLNRSWAYQQNKSQNNNHPSVQSINFQHLNNNTNVQAFELPKSSFQPIQIKKVNE